MEKTKSSKEKFTRFPEKQEFFQTKVRGTFEEEYGIYVKCAKDLGWKIKTFDEWMQS